MHQNRGPTDLAASPSLPVDQFDLNSFGRGLGPEYHHHPGHSVQFYEDDAFLLDELSRFIGSALGAGDAGVVLATPAHREGLAERLTARGVDVDLATAQGRYLALDAAEMLSVCLQDGLLDAGRFNEHIGGLLTDAAIGVGGQPRRVAVFGELVALLYADGKGEAAVQLEGYWNDLSRTHSFDLLCAYPLTSFRYGSDVAMIEQICAAHSHVIPAESYTSLSAGEERLRSIALLQQKARALQTEIEDRKRIEQLLRERNQELRAALEARDQFLSVAAHELKTPITTLRAFAQLLLRDFRRNGTIAPERLTPALDAVEAQTGKLNQLVIRLLDTAQIEAGRLRVERESADLVALVQAAITQQYHDADHTHMFVVDGPERLEAMVDPLQFEQVITNLLDNAVKFSPPGSPVRIQLRQDGGGIHLSITDQGSGIPPGERDQVFERFHQAHGGEHVSGLGLGLYITREIVAMHEGEVRIEETDGGGSRFIVTLPAPASGVPAHQVA